MQTHIESRVVHDQPTLTTARLTLRPFVADDAFDVERLAGKREIADTTLHIPHPYSHCCAAAGIWLRTPGGVDGTSGTFAIVSKKNRAAGGAGHLTGRTSELTVQR